MGPTPRRALPLLRTNGRLVTLTLPRRLIDTLPDHEKLLTAGLVAVAPDIDGWSWLRPTVIAGKRYDWWQHETGHLRLAPSLLDALEGLWTGPTSSPAPSPPNDSPTESETSTSKASSPDAEFTSSGESPTSAPASPSASSA
jgi:hypothetical protein